MKLSPSLYAAPPDLARVVAEVGPHADSWHFDVMDGHFAPAFGLNVAMFQALRGMSPLPIDVHLMLNALGDWPQRFAGLGARRVIVHAETATPETLATIRAAGAAPWVALKPSTSATALAPFAPDGVLILTAPPGGGAFDTDALKRPEALTLPTILDGGIGPAQFDRARAMGVETLVLGRALFDAPDLGQRAAALSRAAGG